MARYGEGYYTDLTSLTVAINNGLNEAFILTCEQLLDEIKQWTDVYIYNKSEGDYIRTEEFRESFDYTEYNVTNGYQEATFYIDVNKIKTIGNPFHHVLEEGGTGDDLFSIIDSQHNGLRDDIEFWIRDEFKKKYQTNCKTLGISLS